MTTIYIVRHAEAEGNVYRRAQGQYNSNLTKFGKSQLPYLAERFKEIPVDIIYASDLKRAFLTVKSIADVKNLEVIKNENLREINMGDMEDYPWAELPLVNKEVADKWNYNPKDCQFPNGESTESSADRFYQEFFDIASKNRGKNIVIGSHGAVIRYFLYKVKGIDYSDVSALEWCENTGVTKILVDDDNNLTIEYEFDSSHLANVKEYFKSPVWWKLTPEEKEIGYNLSFETVDLEKDFEILCEFMKDYHFSNYFNEQKFNEDDFLIKCKRLQEILPESVQFAKSRDKIVGMTICDLTFSNKNIGHIYALDLQKDFRGSCFAPQVIGNFVHIYRKLGKDTLRAVVYKNNISAVNFFEKLDFVCYDETEKENYFVMDLDLRV